MKLSTRIFFVLAGLLLSALLNPATAGCMCRNYTGESFCVESIPACQAQAGNCLEECIWQKSDQAKKKNKKVRNKKVRKEEDAKKKSMLIF
jgi:hypothetical protein